MFWIALLPSDEQQRTTWGWWGLQYTRASPASMKRCAGALGPVRLWGGKPAAQAAAASHPELGSSIGRRARPRDRAGAVAAEVRGPAVPSQARKLPLETLTAAREHVETRPAPAA